MKLKKIGEHGLIYRYLVEGYGEPTNLDSALIMSGTDVVAVVAGPDGRENWNADKEKEYRETNISEVSKWNDADAIQFDPDRDDSQEVYI